MERSVAFSKKLDVLWNSWPLLYSRWSFDRIITLPTGGFDCPPTRIKGTLLVVKEENNDSDPDARIKCESSWIVWNLTNPDKT